MCNILEEKLTEEGSISRKRTSSEGSDSPVFKKPKIPENISKMYSNDLSNCVKIFCCECDKVINLSGLRKHINKVHMIKVRQYKALYGDPRAQIIKMVFHNCGLCKKDIVLDYETMHRHLKYVHKVTTTEYNKKYMKVKLDGKLSSPVSIRPRTPPSPVMMKSITDDAAKTNLVATESIKQEPGMKMITGITEEGRMSPRSKSPPVKSSSASFMPPAPACDLCFRLFLSKMELKMHKIKFHEGI